MNSIGEDECPKCGKTRTIYDNETAYCENCDSHFDLGMKKYKK